MRKWIVVLVVCLSASVLGAEEPEDSRWELSLGVGASLAIISGYATVSASAGYKPRVLGIGVGVKGLVGLQYADVYLAGFARLDIGWVYLGAGAAVPVKGPREQPGLVTTTPVAGPYLALGLAHGFIPLGPGKLGLDVGAEALFTAVAVEPGDDVGSAAGSVIEAVLLSIFGAVKVHVSVLYEMRL